MIHQWAMCDSEEVNTVVMSNFQRAFRTVLSRQEFNNKIPLHLINEVLEQKDQHLIEGSE
jgi:hypothetical protein